MSVLGTIIENRIIAIARGFGPEELIPASKALYDGGVRVFEVAFEHGKDLVRTADAIGLLAESLPSGCAVGAGTVLSPEEVRLAGSHGASFIISPNTDKEVIAATKRLGLISIPGAMTPSEIVAAHSYGADIVKVFPAGMLGIEYFKAIRAPLSHIPMAAVAGVTLDNISAFRSAGAIAFGISSSLYNAEAVRSGDYEKLRALAEAFVSKVK